MKLIGACLVLIFFVFNYPSVFAHGGFEKRAGSVIVYVKQDPISPLVGEKVKLSLSFRDEGISETGNLSAQNLTDWPVILSVVDTYYGDESKDEVIYNNKFQTDANGSFTFEYTFLKENYFDIDLDFKDSKGNNLETGFLIQPRDPEGNVQNPDLNPQFMLLSFIIGGITILALLKFLPKTHS